MSFLRWKTNYDLFYYTNTPTTWTKGERMKNVFNIFSIFRLAFRLATPWPLLYGIEHAPRSNDSFAFSLSFCVCVWGTVFNNFTSIFRCAVLCAIVTMCTRYCPFLYKKKIPFLLDIGLCKWVWLLAERMTEAQTCKKKKSAPFQRHALTMQVYVAC